MSEAMEIDQARLEEYTLMIAEIDKEAAKDLTPGARTGVETPS